VKTPGAGSATAATRFRVNYLDNRCRFVRGACCHQANLSASSKEIALIVRDDIPEPLILRKPFTGLPRRGLLGNWDSGIGKSRKPGQGVALRLLVEQAVELVRNYPVALAGYGFQAGAIADSEPAAAVGDQPLALKGAGYLAYAGTPHPQHLRE
jgi:hypothetical protein